MRILVLSDLHIEFFDFKPEPIEADVVVLAGDILTEHYGLQWARRSFPELPVVYVMGNHEFYDANYEMVLDRARVEAQQLDVHLLECNEVVVNGTRFLGATMWTDFEIEKSDAEPPGHAFWWARRNMNDFRLIRYRGGLLSPEDTREIHYASRSWLTQRIEEPFDGSTVVVTHHLPHLNSINPRFRLDPLNPAFASHMPELVQQPVDLWIHGHTHCSCDYHVGETRVLCNPRGYGPNDLNPQFNPALIAEVG